MLEYLVAVVAVAAGAAATPVGRAWISRGGTAVGAAASRVPADVWVYLAVSPVLFAFGWVIYDCYCAMEAGSIAARRIDNSFARIEAAMDAAFTRLNCSLTRLEATLAAGIVRLEELDRRFFNRTGAIIAAVITKLNARRLLAY